MSRWPKASFSRGLTGLHAISALAARAAGDRAACQREVRRFIEAARRARGSMELFQGAAGRLAGAAIMMREIPDPGVRSLGDELGGRLLAAFGRALAGRAAGPHAQGMAHGWPGVALALLGWQAVSRSLPEDALRRAVIAVHPYDVSALTNSRQVDWAHGHAGMAHLFARAHVQLGDRRFLAWARVAARRALAWPSHGFSLPSGAGGIAYAMLAMAAADPEGPWREAAWTAAGHALARIEVPELDPYGVWSGLGGACCLALDLVHETRALFPGLEG
jgi:hypothetical protein